MEELGTTAVDNLGTANQRPLTAWGIRRDSPCGWARGDAAQVGLDPGIGAKVDAEIHVCPVAAPPRLARLPF